MLAGERRAFQTHAVCFGSLLVSAVPWLICLFPMLVLEMGWSSHLELRHPILSSWFCLWSQSPWRLQPLRPDCSVPLLLSSLNPCSRAGGGPRSLVCLAPALGARSTARLLSLPVLPFVPMLLSVGPCLWPPRLPEGNTNHESYQNLLYFPISVCMDVIMPSAPRVPLEGTREVMGIWSLFPYSTGIWKRKAFHFLLPWYHIFLLPEVAFTFPSPCTIMMNGCAIKWAIHQL